MADSTVAISLNEFSATRMGLQLANGQSVFQNTTVAGDTTTGTVKKAASGSTTLVFLGVANETLNNTSGASVELDVNFLRERKFVWRTNDGTISAANVFSPCYMKDNQSVTLTATGNSLFGTIFKVDAQKGVLVAIT